jgi:hypothetical protein
MGAFPKDITQAGGTVPSSSTLALPGISAGFGEFGRAAKCSSSLTALTVLKLDATGWLGSQIHIHALECFPFQVR